MSCHAVSFTNKLFINVSRSVGRSVGLLTFDAQICFASSPSPALPRRYRVESKLVCAPRVVIFPGSERSEHILGALSDGLFPAKPKQMESSVQSQKHSWQNARQNVDMYLAWKSAHM